MKTKLICFVICFLLLFTAFAQEYSGKTVFLKTHTEYSSFEGTIEETFLTIGNDIQLGEEVMTVEEACIYADMDATVRGVKAEEGERISKKAFTLEPKEKYKLLGSVTYAYGFAENSLVHVGETVYIACVKDATHLAKGYVSRVDGGEFTVYTTHGSLYPGEAVSVYRAENRDYKTRIGRATVYATDSTDYEIKGMVTKMYVAEGDRVEKGEVLIRYLPGENAPESKEIASDVCGIITDVFVQPGDAVQKGDKLFEYACISDIGIHISVPSGDMNGISFKNEVNVRFLIDSEEDLYTAHVVRVAPQKNENEAYDVYLALEQPSDFLMEGLSLTVIQ